LKQISLCLTPVLLGLALPLLATPSLLIAQTTSAPTDISGPNSSYNKAGKLTPPKTAKDAKTAKKAVTAPKPFSRLALGGGVSLMGVNMQAAVNANRYINLRGTGNFLNYTVNNIGVDGFNITGKLNYATGGASVDFYPFPNHGFRLSPGALFYNQNDVAADVTATGGTSFTLNGQTYYSSATNPVKGTGSVGLHTNSPTFTMTTGWGNMISRRGGHWSFPFELGAAMIGAPAVDLKLTSGQVCTDSAGTLGCVDVVGNTELDKNLQAQIVKYKNDLDPFRFYPIVSFGVSYNFAIR
jgi:hypothetical protein